MLTRRLHASATAPSLLCPCYDPRWNGQDYRSHHAAGANRDSGCHALLFVGAYQAGFSPQPTAIGVNTPVTVHVANPHGLRQLTAILEQDGARTTIDEIKNPADRLKFWLAQFPAQEIHFDAGSKEAPNLKEGKARLVVEAQSNDFRGVTDTISTDVDVVLRPPSVSADGFQHYINQGGSEMVLFTPSGSWSEAGVRVGKDSVSEFPRCRQRYRAVGAVRVSRGTRRLTPCRWFTRGTRRARRQPRGSGSRYSRRSSACATWRSTISSWTKSSIRSIPAAPAICSPASSKSTAKCGARTTRR